MSDLPFDLSKYFKGKSAFYRISKNIEFVNKKVDVNCNVGSGSSESSGVVFKENEYYSCPNFNLHINLKFVDKDTNNPIRGIILEADNMVEYELADDGSFGWNVRRPLLLNDEYSWEGGYGYLYPTGGFQNGNSSDSFSFESQKDAESGEYGLYFDGFGLSNTTDNGYFVGYWKDIGDEVTITVPVDIVGGANLINA